MSPSQPWTQLEAEVSKKIINYVINITTILLIITFTSSAKISFFLAAIISIFLFFI